jgi:hypothetical protein
MKSARAPGIRRILDARFSLSALEASKNSDPEWWNSETNDMGRCIYGEELAAIARQETFVRFREPR